MEKEYIEILSQELSRKRKNKTTYRVKPSECPINKKYCIVNTKNNEDNSVVEKFRCPYIKKIGLGNEDAICLVECYCVNNSSRYIMEDD